MTPLPPRRRQHPLHLEGVWLVTGSIEGAREVPGMSVVADPRGFTIVGPEPGRERTVPWEQTTGFTCQRPARLPDGSPATVLEVGLANGRVLELLLPVTRVPPSETVVVETELAVMAEQYGGGKSIPETPGVPSAPPAGDLQTSPSSSKASPSNGSNGSKGTNGSGAPVPERALRGQTDDGALFEAPLVEEREQVAALALNGSHSNGSSARGTSRLVVDIGVTPSPDPPAPAQPASAPPAPAAAPAPVPPAPATAQAAPPTPAAAPPKPAVAVRPKPAVADPTLDVGPVTVDAPATAPEPASTSARAPLQAPKAVSVAETHSLPTDSPKAGVPQTDSAETNSAETDSAETDSAKTDPPKPESREAESHEADSREAEPKSGEVAQAGDMERRENRLFKMLVALIGVVVLVLIAELVLILFVLNHNPNAKTSSVQSPTAMIRPHSTRDITHDPNALIPGLLIARTGTNRFWT